MPFEHGAADEAAPIRVIRGKGGPSEAEATRLLARHARFESALRQVAVASGES